RGRKHDIAKWIDPERRSDRGVTGDRGTYLRPRAGAPLADLLGQPLESVRQAALALRQNPGAAERDLSEGEEGPAHKRFRGIADGRAPVAQIDPHGLPPAAVACKHAGTGVTALGVAGMRQSDSRRLVADRAGSDQHLVIANDRYGQTLVNRRQQ